MPRSLADAAALDLRLRRLDESHVAPLNAFVRQLQNSHGGSGTVPWFDPDDGGVRARILALSEAPGARSVQSGVVRARGGGSGIISSDNNDGTAANFSRARDEAGVPRSWLLSWNIVPWYLGDAVKIATPTRADRAEAAPSTQTLLSLLPDLEVVLALGEQAQLGWGALLGAGKIRDDLVFVPAPHPSPQNINTRPAAWERLVSAFQVAAAVVRSRDGDEPRAGAGQLVRPGRPAMPGGR